MTTDQVFWNRLADRYAADPIADETAYQTKVKATRQLLRPDMELFEFGCGTGSTALLHAPHVRHIRAMDFSHRMIEIARSKSEAAKVSNISFEVGSIEDADLAPQSLDMVLALSVLHLLRDKRAAIAKTYAALKPGGYFVSSTACLKDMLPIIGLVAPIGKLLGFMPHLDMMSVADLRNTIEEEGFSVEHQWQPKRKAATFFIAKKPA